MDVDGEIFIIKTLKGGVPKFQLVESHRVQTPPELVGKTNITEGIQFNQFGQPTFYYISGRDNVGFSRIPAASIMHIYEAVRSTAVRAYPPHQHALNNLRDEMDLLSMEKLAAKDNSRVSRILKTTDNVPDIGDVGLGEPTNRNPATDPMTISRTLGGVTAVLNSNEELVAHEYARPSSAFTGFIDHLRRDSCMGNSLPYEILVSPSSVGGAAARYIVSKTNRYVSRRQNIIIEKFLVPYFEFWLGTKIDRGDLPSARNWWKAEFQTGKPITVDAGRESANDRADLMMGTLTPQDYFQQQGKNYERAIIQKAKNLAFREKVATAYNINPDKLINLKSPSDIQAEATQRQAEIQAAASAAEQGLQPPMANNEKPADTEIEILDPELKEPTVDAPAPPVQLQSLVDSLPLQNEGLSRNPENPNYNP
jgi:capsid protein